MAEFPLRNPYQVQLAETSIRVSPSSEGEYWEFRWYIDPLSRGLSRWFDFNAHVSWDGEIQMIGMSVPFDEDEDLAQEQAVRFVQERYNEFGIDEIE